MVATLEIRSGIKTHSQLKDILPSNFNAISTTVSSVIKLTPIAWLS
jgi:hypothetical protein